MFRRKSICSGATRVQSLPELGPVDCHKRRSVWASVAGYRCVNRRSGRLGVGRCSEAGRPTTDIRLGSSLRTIAEPGSAQSLITRRSCSGVPGVPRTAHFVDGGRTRAVRPWRARTA